MDSFCWAVFFFFFSASHRFFLSLPRRTSLEVHFILESVTNDLSNSPVDSLSPNPSSKTLRRIIFTSSLVYTCLDIITPYVNGLLLCVFIENLISLNRFVVKYCFGHKRAVEI